MKKRFLAAFLLFFRFFGLFWGSGELLTEFVAGVGSEDFLEPRFARSLIFRRQNFDNVKIFEFFV